jgi:hypothetical protein
MGNSSGRAVTPSSSRIDAAPAASYPEPEAREARIRQLAGIEAHSLMDLRQAAVRSDIKHDFAKSRVQVLYVPWRIDRLFPPTITLAVLEKLPTPGLCQDAVVSLCVRVTWCCCQVCSELAQRLTVRSGLCYRGSPLNGRRVIRA